MSFGYHSLFFDSNISYSDYVLAQDFAQDEIVSPITKSAAQALGFQSENIAALASLSSEFGVSLSRDQELDALSDIQSSISQQSFTNDLNYGELLYVNIQLNNLHDKLYDIDTTLSWQLGEISRKIGYLDSTLKELLVVVKSPSQTWSLEQFHIASKAYKGGHFQDAIFYLNNAIHGTGGNTGYRLDFRYYHLLGLSYMGGRNGERCGNTDLSMAEAMFMKAETYCEEDIHKSECLLFAGMCSSYQKEFNRALLQLERSQKLNHLNPSIPYLLSKVYLALKNDEMTVTQLAASFVGHHDFIVKALADADFFKRIDLRDRAIKIFKQREAISVLSLIKRQSFLWHQTSGFIRSLGENIYNETKVRTSMNEAHLILKKFEPLDVTSETIQEVFTYNIIQFDNVLDDAIDRNDQFSQQLSEAVKKDCSAPIIKNNKKIADLAQTIDEYISGTYGPRADLYGDIDAFQSDFFELIGIKG